MNRATEHGPHAGLARHPKLVAAAIGLAMLLFASPIHAAGRGSAQNPIFLPGTETTSSRIAPPARRDRVVVRRGSFEATLYALPARTLAPGTRLRLSADTRSRGGPARAELDAARVGDRDLGGAGLKLALHPAWDVELEGKGYALGDMASPASAARTRGRFPVTQVGVEVRFF